VVRLSLRARTQDGHGNVVSVGSVAMQKSDVININRQLRRARVMQSYYLDRDNMLYEYYRGLEKGLEMAAITLNFSHPLERDVVVESDAVLEIINHPPTLVAIARGVTPKQIKEKL